MIPCGLLRLMSFNETGTSTGWSGHLHTRGKSILKEVVISVMSNREITCISGAWNSNAKKMGKIGVDREEST